MSKIDELIALALGEVGYPEHASAKDLDSRTKNIGSANYTKYSRDLTEAGVSGHPNGYAWCQTFIAWLFWKVFDKDTANKLLCGQLRSASTMTVKDAFKAKGQLVPVKDAKPGDIMFRSRNGGGHVGLYIGSGYTVEGNSSPTDKTAWNGGETCRHKDGYWEWCARPDYSIVKKYDAETWYSDATGWWYAKTETDYAKNEFLIINHHKYYFDERGYIVTGHQVIDGRRYYFETSGSLQGAMMWTDQNGILTVKEY